MGDLRRRQISVLVLSLTIFLTLLPPHNTLIKAELLTAQNIVKKFGQHQNPHHLEQCNKPKKLQCKRRELLATELNKEDDNGNIKANISRTTVEGKNIVWCRDCTNPNSDRTVRLMRDQVIMADVYAQLARRNEETELSDSLIRRSKACLDAIGEADLDVELQPKAFKQAEKMDSILSIAEEKLHDCSAIPKKLRVMIHDREDNLMAQDKKTHFLAQLTSKTVPKSLHCLPQLLTMDYFSGGFEDVIIQKQDRLEDPSLYHYAIFSDNVLATSVVVNSAVLNAKEPEKHVFHIVTDGLNFRAMRMWFLLNPPAMATVQVQSIDDFTWLNPSYCPVLRHLESPEMKEYHFKDNNKPSKYRNPKYLSILNHLRFYLPEIFPKLNKILFLDDDTVVQKDLTPLWSVDMKGMVNGAVKACKGGFHRLADYLNFDIPIISSSFDPDDCPWGFGMNIFDLKQWRAHNITEMYHFWQQINEKENWKAWKLGSLPSGLVAFYNHTYLVDMSWHVMGLGYDPELSLTEVKNAAVIHYSGNCKPWMDCGIADYKGYWSNYLMFDSPQIQQCNIGEYLGHPFAI